MNPNHPDPQPDTRPAPWLALTTVATQAQARALAHAMVQARHAACAQIQPIESVYRWQDAVQQEGEWRVLFKTTAAAWPALQDALRQQHPYALPAICALPCSAALPAFTDWVAAQTGPAAPLP
ncbi:MAG: divalent-cation tolerance protein CutA [Comamonadaceae bacterium]|nr:divalent-cation tolerance protein CutA [Comamonadaceae bacterium]